MVLRCTEYTLFLTITLERQYYHANFTDLKNRSWIKNLPKIRVSLTPVHPLRRGNPHADTPLPPHSFRPSQSGHPSCSLSGMVVNSLE